MISLNKFARIKFTAKTGWPRSRLWWTIKTNYSGNMACGIYGRKSGREKLRIFLGPIYLT